MPARCKRLHLESDADCRRVTYAVRYKEQDTKELS